jgi:hypothetical protein
MYRRVERINHYPPRPGSVDDQHDRRDIKHGIMGVSTPEVADAWISDDVPDLHAPKHLHKNCRFYFTELGWEVYGRRIVAACIRSRQDYRVLRIKEASADIVWQDDYQVAVRPKRKR